MSKFDHDFDWQRALLPEVKRACATHLICEAPPEEDMKHNTDLIVLKMDTVRIAVRLRRNSYLTQRNYANEFTIRSTRPKSQADAQTILCPDCHAPIGQTCLNTITGKPLERFPAHINRINKSKESK
jgi:hypothetical protein